jgi:8-amino-7-oxononanoate synthase
MGLFDKYKQIIGRHSKLEVFDVDPFNVCVDRVLSPTVGIVNGQETILVGTNNYLGLTFEEDCVDQAVDALRAHGTATTGSRIANGTYTGHLQLEKDIASFLDYRTAIVFPTGYQANLGILAGLADKSDTILLDADSHASIYDGCTLSGATMIRFRHNSPADLDKRLERLKDDPSNKLVVVESIYSMLGDRAPLDEFVDVKNRHAVSLLVDEAHSLGIFGEHGQGLAAEMGVSEEVDYTVGTFSKSLGAVGGFGASNHPMFDTLRYTSRPYMYTASSSPSNVAAAIATLKHIRTRPELRVKLWENAKMLYDSLSELGYDICAPMSPIIAVRMPDEETAIYHWNLLFKAGIYVNLALPPGAPNGTCLLRCSVSARHSSEQIRQIADAFASTSEIIRQDELQQAAAAS